MTEQEAWGVLFGEHHVIPIVLGDEARAVIKQALEEVQQYRELGTIQELKEAKEKQMAKKPNLYGDYEDGKLLCPKCEEDLMDLIDCGFNNCPYCGQVIDWSEEDKEA